MRTVATDVATRELVTAVSPAKLAEPIEMPLELKTWAFQMAAHVDEYDGIILR